MPEQKTRKFEGKTYRLVNFFTSKRKANALASEWREKGYRVRVTTGRGRPVYYDVWVRK